MAPGQASHSPRFPVDFIGLPKVAVPLGFGGKCICTTLSFPSSPYPQEVLSSAKMTKNASLLHLRVCLCGYEYLPAGKPAYEVPPLTPSPKLKQAGCNCEGAQLTPAGPCSELQKMLFHVQMQMTISSLERAGTVFPSEWGTGALEEHLAKLSG